MIVHVLKEEREQLIQKKDTYMNEIKYLPVGSIVNKKINKKEYKYIIYRDSKGNVKSKYLKEIYVKETAQLIDRRKQLQMLLKEIEVDINILDKSIKIGNKEYSKKENKIFLKEGVNMKIKSIYDLIEREGFNLAIALFLDNFNHSNKKYELIKEGPIVKNIDRDTCLIASIIHKLASDNDIEIPCWVFDEKYICKEPYYQFDTKNEEYQEFLRENAPEEFKRRNIFFTENILSRV